MSTISRLDAAVELQRRRKARKELLAYIQFVDPKYKVSEFSRRVCASLDQFITDVFSGKRPILVLQGPPQHGKSSIVSRYLPAFLMSVFNDIHIGTASYADGLAGTMAQDVRRILSSDLHHVLFPREISKKKYDIDRQGEFSNPYGPGSYIGVGVGGGLTGRPITIGIIDDPVKNQQEALSQTTKESVWNWYQSVFTTRLSENSGQVIMATSWAEDDLAGRVQSHFKGDRRLTVLKFPAINDKDEVGYNPDLPLGALVPALHSLEKLKETKSLLSAYWWSAMYQQSAKSLGGNVFSEEYVRYYLPKDLPKKFDKVINSWDCTFKDTDGTDYVVGTVWGKAGANSYLLDLVRERMSFTRTVKAVIDLRNKWPQTIEILIEDKANGTAVIDVLKTSVPGLIPIEPDGSKLARSHAVTSYWEAGNVHIPDPSIAPWVKGYMAEMTYFPASANDDQVDSTTQALRRLYPAFAKLSISQEAIHKAMGR